MFFNIYHNYRFAYLIVHMLRKRKNKHLDPSLPRRQFCMR
nr:MAG TPA: hypothetical protein [Caudoviricetes sp.]DAS11397.1 MAG TPA: hypothetical protein [Caudoviricetes sp.]